MPFINKILMDSFIISSVFYCWTQLLSLNVCANVHPSDGMHSTLGYQPLLQSLFYQQTCKGGILPFHQSLMNKLNNIGTSVEPQRTVACFRLDPVPLITTLWVLLFSHFSIHLTAHSSNPHFLSLLMRMLWKTELKALLKLRLTVSTALPSSLQAVV